MAELWSFDRDVWSDMRRAIRATGLWSFWYRVIFAMTILLSERAARAKWLKQQIWLDSATEYGLTLWGQRYEIPRYYGESDEDYKSRIIAERMIARGDASNASRKKILQVVYGVDPADVQIIRLYDHHFAVGGLTDRPGYEGAIGSPIGSRDAAMHVFRIYAPLPDDYEAKITKAVKMLTDINIGGNVWELWFDRGATSGPQTQADDRPLDQGALAQLRNYTKY